MKTEKIMTKSTKTLVTFAITYTAITIYFVADIKRDESASLGYLFLFPTFWLIGGLMLGLLFWFTKIKVSKTLHKIALIFSTPGPTLVFFFIWSMLPYSQSPASTYEFNINGYRHRQVKYQYDNGQLKKVEYYMSQDSVTEENPFPEKDIWLKDSIWTYYNKDGTIEREYNIRRTATNCTFATGGGFALPRLLLVIGSSVIRINICSEKYAHHKSAKRTYNS